MSDLQLNTLAEKNVISVQVLFRRWDWESCAPWEYSMQIKEMAYRQGLSFTRAIASEDTSIFWTKISAKVTNKPLPSSHGSVI